VDHKNDRIVDDITQKDESHDTEEKESEENG
jgi:hypothetical protein